MKLIATCAFGLESPVKWELQKLGYAAKPTVPGRIEFEGDWKDVCRTNLWLRTADRVLIEVAKFDASDFEALFETCRAVEWHKWLPPRARFPVNGRSRLSQLTSVPAIQRSVKKAIVESLLRGHQTTTLPEDGPEYRIEVAILNNMASLTIDTTGPSLHKRGYRRSSGQAPIKETLAAAMVMLSVWNPDRPLIDPFCGSGTIVVEAALIGRNIPPGLRRSFTCHQWPEISEHIIEQLRSDAEQNIRHDLRMQILGTDDDAEVLKHARLNAEWARVADTIHFQHKSFEDLRSKRQYGCVITNPPYGERLSERKALLPLYQSFPAVLQRLPTWSHFIITNVPQFEGLIQSSATRRRKLYNGRIECMYYQYLGPRPPRANDLKSADHADAAPAKEDQPADDDNTTGGGPRPQQSALATLPKAVFGGLTDKDQAQAELFATRLTKRARHLRRWPTKKGITCFRLYERDIPELPFVVDRYEQYFHMTEYERPHDRDLGRHAAWLELMKKTVAKTFEVPIGNVFLKSRRRQAGDTQHTRQESQNRSFVVTEGGLKFSINLSDYVDTGLFLDHRQTRQMVRSDSDGKHFLNLFAYTGSFSVYAADGQAASTTTVDWSKTYLDWAKANMNLNGFEDERHQFVRSGVMEFLTLGPHNQKYDLVVVDPPTFSNSKRTEHVWDVQENHLEMLDCLAPLIAENGVVYFSTNFRKFKFNEQDLKCYKSMEISTQTIPEDFRNRKIHRCWKLKKV